MAIEDAFAQWLQELLEKEGFVVKMMPRHRHADVLVRRAYWTEDHLWVRLQIKTDGGLQDDDETPKPVDQHGRWYDTFQYGAVKGTGKTKALVPADRMLVVLGMRRGHTYEEVLAAEYALWCVDGGRIASDEMNTSATPGDDALTLASLDADCPEEMRQPCTIEQLVACIDRANEPGSVFPPTTYDAAFLDVKEPNHRKKMMLMLCMQQALDPGMTYTEGNSPVIDCLFRGDPSHVSSVSPLTGAIPLNHTKKGKEGTPFDRADGIQCVAGGFVLKSIDRYFLFLATLSLDVLLENGVFSDGPKAVTCTCPSLHLLPQYEEWVRGKARAYQKHGWRDDPRNTLGHPIEIKPSGRLSKALLDEHAHPSPRPDKHPSDADIARHRAGGGLISSHFASGAGPSGA